MKEKKKIITIKGIIIWSIALLLWAYNIISAIPMMTKNRCQNYLIEHKDELNFYPEYSDSTHYYFRIEPIEDLGYYEVATIRYYPGDYYYIIFWGDRDDWRWFHKKDKDFRVDMEKKNDVLNTILNNKIK